MTLLIDPDNPYVGIGRFIGLCDEDGRQLAEGDIVTYTMGDCKQRGKRKIKSRPDAILKVGLIVWDVMEVRYRIRDLRDENVWGVIASHRQYLRAGDYRLYLGQLVARWDQGLIGPERPPINDLRCPEVRRIGQCAGPEVIERVREFGFSEASIKEAAAEYYEGWKYKQS